MTYADTSFIVALFAPDDHHHKAWAWWREHQSELLTVSRLTILEAENTMRTMAIGGRCRPAESRRAIFLTQRALTDGLLMRRSVSERRLFPTAHRLSVQHCERAAYGALDILHVATARELGALHFLSFDTRQRELAEAAGLTVAP
jgi:predicted nucleic acid-binding protein